MTPLYTIIIIQMLFISSQSFLKSTIRKSSLTISYSKLHNLLNYYETSNEDVSTLMKTWKQPSFRVKQISQWVFEKGKPENAVEIERRSGKSYVRIRDYNRVRELFGELLGEIQRIKSEGDFESGKKMVEAYGVKVDKALHSEVIERYSKLNLAPYTGFVNPYLLPVYDSNGGIRDIVVEYTDDYLGQMMYYGTQYSYLLPD